MDDLVAVHGEAGAVLIHADAISTGGHQLHAAPGLVHILEAVMDPDQMVIAETDGVTDVNSLGTSRPHVYELGGFARRMIDGINFAFVRKLIPPF